LAKHLTKGDVRAILNIIEGWGNRKLTWNDICQEASKIVGKMPTRQSLNSNESIKAAYTVKKKGLKFFGPRISSPSSLKVASARIAKLTSEIDTLKARNSALLEQFVRWQYVMHKHGIKEHDLAGSLPKIDRERTDKETRS
jgi:hypothetical protein